MPTVNRPLLSRVIDLLKYSSQSVSYLEKFIVVSSISKNLSNRSCTLMVLIKLQNVFVLHCCLTGNCTLTETTQINCVFLIVGLHRLTV